MPEKKRVAISIKNVSKDFRLPHHNQPSTIKSTFVNPFRARKPSDFKEGVEKQHALQDVSFDVYEGEFFGIVGKNGSGKSTLLKIIAGIYKPNKGKVHYSGKLVPFIELGVGFNPELTGRDNVYLSGALMGFSTKEVDKKYQKIVEFAELERFMDQSLKNYSSGMQVRLAFSVATILGDSDILLIDEVLAVGDADFQRKCFNYFKTLKKLKKTVVFVSHDMSAVREYCDRAALIDQGEVIAVGDAEESAKKYTQLFARDDSGQKPNLRSKRWGNGKASFSDVSVEQIDYGKSILVTANVHAKETIDDPTYGIMVSNDKGQPILGTNSHIIRADVTALRADTDITVSWEFPNIFNEGKLYIELVLMYDSITEVADWWGNAATFTVRNEIKNPYIVNPPVKFIYKGGL
ncbi:MAG: ABC transporter ATP-binding protein [Candidatus Saccharimonadales bacterium]